MKYLLGVVVAIVIFMIASVVAKFYDLYLSSILNSMGDISQFKYVAIGVTGLIPFILGFWLIKLSWKKIVGEKD